MPCYICETIRLALVDPLPSLHNLTRFKRLDIQKFPAAVSLTNGAGETFQGKAIHHPSAAVLTSSLTCVQSFNIVWPCASGPSLCPGTAGTTRNYPPPPPPTPPPLQSPPQLTPPFSERWQVGGGQLSVRTTTHPKQQPQNFTPAAPTKKETLCTVSLNKDPAHELGRNPPRLTIKGREKRLIKSRTETLQWLPKLGKTEEGDGMTIGWAASIIICHFHLQSWHNM